MRTLLVALTLAGCDRGVSKEQLEAESAKVRAYADRAVEMTEERAWYCVYNPKMSAVEQGCTRDSTFCSDMAASSWSACIMTKVAWCIDNHCYLTPDVCADAQHVKYDACKPSIVQRCTEPASADDPFCMAWNATRPR